MLTIQAHEGQDLPLGRQGENYARRVSFDFSAWAAAYGFGIPRLLVQRPSDSAPYPVTLSAETDSEHVQARAFWDVSATDTEHAGTGRAELRYYAGETLVKSAVFHTSVTPSLAIPETAPPPPGSSWADGILDAASRAERAALDAALATANIDNVQVRTVTLEPGSPASVSAVSENGVRTMTFSIPAGTPGRDGTDGTNGINGTDGTNGTDGADGADGVSVTGIETVSATTLSGGENTYRLVLSNGEKLPFSVRNGAKGDKGDPFTIAASYASYNAMTADFSNANIPEGSFVVISSNPEDPHNAELYHKGGAAWELVTDLSGAQGLTGPPGNGIDYVEENTNSAGDTLVTLHFTDSNVQPFPFTVHRGLPGQNGANGGRGEKGDDGEKGDKGDDATINGVNALTIQPGNNNIHFSQSGSVLSISSDNTTYSPAVSGGANGLMSGADKAKLDSISLPAGGISVPDTLPNQSIATFQSSATGRPLRVTVNIEPVQAGSGDPSPSNVRAFAGWTGANVYVSPTTTAADGTVYNITFPSSAGTVYGGTLDVARGLLTVTRVARKINTFNWTFYAGWNAFFYDSPLFLADGNILCECYRNHKGGNITSVDEIVWNNGWGLSRNNLVIRDTQYGSDVASFLAASGNYLISANLANPITYQLTPQQIVTLAGTNNVFADCGPVTVTHWPGTGTPVEPVDDGAEIAWKKGILDRFAALEGGS